MRFETRLLADLRPAEYNPRVPLKPGDPEWETIKNSILEFGYSDPIVINSDGTIIKGHQRRNVMMDLGYTEAEVIVLDIKDKNKEKALNVALNKITGRWDNNLLKDILQELDLDGYDFTTTGFERKDLEDLIQLTDIPAEAQDDDFDPDAAAEEVKETITKDGDIWQLGRHRLMCGDSTKPADIAALLDGQQMDLVITDPPYNVDYGAKVNGTPGLFKNDARGDHDYIMADAMKTSDFTGFILQAFQNIYNSMRPGAAIYVFHADVNGLYFRAAFQRAGFKLAQCLIWEKNVFVLGRNDYQWRHEPILYGWKEGAAHYFINNRTLDTILMDEELDYKSMKKQELLALVDKIFREYKDQTTVLFENKPQRNDLHPTMKPVPLVGKLITNSSRPGWKVGDFFGGSGTTLMAAEQLGRTAYMMELEPVNVDVIVQRWEAYTGQKAVKL